MSAIALPVLSYRRANKRKRKNKKVSYPQYPSMHIVIESLQFLLPLPSVIITNVASSFFVLDAEMLTLFLQAKWSSYLSPRSIKKPCCTQNSFQTLLPSTLNYVITKCPSNVYPPEPHFYTAKLGYAGVYLFLSQNIDCGYLLESPL